MCDMRLNTRGADCTRYGLLRKPGIPLNAILGVFTAGERVIIIIREG